MGVDAAEGELLVALLAGLLEVVVGKAAIVAMVVADGDAMLGSELLKRSLGLDLFFRTQILHEMDKAKVREVVQEDGRCLVSFLGEPSFQLRKETNMGRDHVVNGHALPRLGCDKDLVSSFGLFAAPRCFCHGPEEAACALGRRHLGKATRDLAILGKDLEFWEGEVAKAEMPSDQLGLIVGGGELEFLVFLERRRGVKGEGAAASDTWMRLVAGRRRR